MIAFSGMGIGVGQILPDIFARQMKHAVENVIEGTDAYPQNWWDAAQEHQLLYLDAKNVKDL